MHAPPFAVVLGVAQDGGHPQAGCRRPCCAPAWADPALGHLPSCLAIVDPLSGERWLLDATPALPTQLARLDRVAPTSEGITGIFLTHAHMGHYLGLAALGREAMGARDVPVWAMPRMAAFLRGAGPWEQLVRLGNIRLEPLGLTPVRLNDRLTLTAIPVPHREEYSETVAFRVEGPGASILYLPDIDSWEGWPLTDTLQTVDIAYVDGTFHADGELGPRDMSEVPHPRVVDTMARLADSPLRHRVRFTHLNHTNPLLDPTRPAARAVREAGFGIATEGEVTELG